jgi:hypothetical protein
MVQTSVALPSMSVPFTDSRGRITPIWHEFLRSFVVGVATGNIVDPTTAPNVIAGNGLVGGGPVTSDIPLRVGQGSGIVVNADDVNIDVVDLEHVIGTLDDEIIVSDVSDNNQIKKTTLREVAGLSSPGGADGEVQYNSSGVFGGDSGLSYDGSGTLTTSTSLNSVALNLANGVNITRSGVDQIHFDATTGSNSARIQSDGSGGYALHTATSAGQDGIMTFSGSSTATLTLNMGSPEIITFTKANGAVFAGKMAISRCTKINITASTTQTQGNGALTADYNIVSTVANDNDTVTLPGIRNSGNFCLVKNKGTKILKIYPASGANLGMGTDTAITLQPGAHYSWVAISTTEWDQLDGLLRKTVVSGITASTTQTQGQVPLTADVNQVSTVANANDTVTFPAAQAYSRTIIIINNGANVLQIFPASGDDLGAGVDTAVTLAAGSSAKYTNYDATTWIAI